MTLHVGLLDLQVLSKGSNQSFVPSGFGFVLDSLCTFSLPVVGHHPLAAASLHTSVVSSVGSFMPSFSHFSSFPGFAYLIDFFPQPGSHLYPGFVPHWFAVASWFHTTTWFAVVF